MKVLKIFVRKLFKAVFWLVILTMLFPVLYFAYRGSQPLVLPEFKGLSWYQLQEWRQLEYARVEGEYRVSNPNNPPRYRGQCYATDLTIGVLLTPLQSFGYTVAGLRGVQPSPSYSSIPTDVTYSNFMDKWWITAEKLEWFFAKYSQDTFPNVRFCSINHITNMPSADEFEEVTQKLRERIAELEAINAERAAGQSGE